MKRDMWQMPLSEADPIHEDNSLHGQEKAIRKAYSRVVACWLSWEVDGWHVFFFRNVVFIDVWCKLHGIGKQKNKKGRRLLVWLRKYCPQIQAQYLWWSSALLDEISGCVCSPNASICKTLKVKFEFQMRILNLAKDLSENQLMNLIYSYFMLYVYSIHSIYIYVDHIVSKNVWFGPNVSMHQEDRVWQEALMKGDGLGAEGWADEDEDDEDGNVGWPSDVKLTIILFWLIPNSFRTKPFLQFSGKWGPSKTIVSPLQ